MTKSERPVGAVRQPLTVALVMMIVGGFFAPVARDANAAAASPPQTPVISSADALLNLAEKAGFKNLTDCEQNLLQSAPKGEYANCQSDDDQENDPSKGDKWPDSRQIRAELIRWLCVNEEARKLIDPKGIRIYCAKVSGALDLESDSVPFEIDIKQSRIVDPMSLLNTNIEGLYLDGTWTGPITADSLRTRSAIHLRNGFHADGEVNLRGATVGGNLEAEKGTFNNSKGYALNAGNIKLAGNVFLRDGFNATGEVNLSDATVGGDLDCIGATFMPGSSLLAERARVSGEFWWVDITDGTKSTKPDHKNPNVYLDLDGASAALLADDRNSWPTQDNLKLDGFTYDRFAIVTNPDLKTVVPHDADSRLTWLRLQDRSGGLATQPYQQLAKVLESEGDERGARQVRIAMEDDLRASLPWYRQIWPWLLKWTIGYGYEPWIALWWALGVVFLGYPLFALGYCAGVIGPTDKDAFVDFQHDKLSPAYLPFSAFLFSLDTFLPIVNLGLKERWMLNPNLAPPANVRKRFPHFANWLEPALRSYWLLHVFAGWVLITLFAAGFTGIIRR